jgi:tol-pal system protein YbgF
MKYLKLVLFAVLWLSVVGCTAAKQDAATTSASMEWRVKSLEESFLNFREKRRLQDDENMQNNEAVEERLKSVEGQVASLKTGNSVMDVPADSVEEAPMDKGWVTDLKPEEKGWVEGQEAQPKDPMAESGEEKPWAQVPGPPPVIPEPKVIKRAGTPIAKATAKPRTVSSSKSMYDQGLAKYNADDFEGARGVFDEFLKKYPKDSLVPNALYWKGETYYSQKNFAQAILTFKEVTGRFPKHDKAASALLKIGMSYDKVGDSENAIFYLRAMVEDFPNSDAAKLARTELKRLGG